MAHSVEIVIRSDGKNIMDGQLELMNLNVSADTLAEAVDEAVAHLNGYHSRVLAKARVTEDQPWTTRKRDQLVSGLISMKVATAYQVVTDFVREVNKEKLDMPLDRLVPMVFGWYLHQRIVEMNGTLFAAPAEEEDPTGALRASDQAEVQVRDEITGQGRPMTDEEHLNVYGTIPPEANPDRGGTHDFTSKLAAADETVQLPTIDPKLKSLTTPYPPTGEFGISAKGLIADYKPQQDRDAEIRENWKADLERDKGASEPLKGG